MSKKRRIYSVIDTCKRMLKSFSAQGHGQLLFNALLYRNGKKLNSIEKADTVYFSKLVLDYDKTENPDKVKIEFRNAASNTLLWSKEFTLAEDADSQAGRAFQGFGEAEVSEIVQRRLSDYERLKESEAVREQLQEALARNEELAGELEEATTQLEAKKQVEYYASLLGLALPRVAKMLGKSEAGQALGFLSGVEDEEPKQLEATAQPASDSRTAIVQLVSEYCETLDSSTLGLLYLVMCEFSADSRLIGKTLEFLKDEGGQQHE